MKMFLYFKIVFLFPEALKEYQFCSAFVNLFFLIWTSLVQFSCMCNYRTINPNKGIIYCGFIIICPIPIFMDFVDTGEPRI